jgi:heptose I phosphotransferase
VLPEIRPSNLARAAHRIACAGHAQAAADAAAQGMEPTGDGAMWLDRRYRASLEQAGLANFEAFMRGHGGRRLREMGDRENWRIEPSEHLPRPVFLKKHHVHSWRSWLRAKMGLGPGDTPGRVEARNVRRLTASGVPVMELVGFGEKIRPDGLIESFVLTEELQGYRSLDVFLPERFPNCGLEGRRDPDLQRLIRNLADLVARLHRSGFNHRDLYCCHFFIREPAPGRFEVKLIDLQRVQFRRWFRWRWLVKDLAQLTWSAPGRQVTSSQKMAFLRAYLGVDKLRPCHKRLVRAVLGKAQIIDRRGCRQ